MSPQNEGSQKNSPAQAKAQVMDFYRSVGRECGAALTGQLTDEFQQVLKDAHRDVAAPDCHFYHTLEFADGEIIPGGWDLRGSENSYLGHVDFAGRRVLEFGPASGFLTFHMEAQGAEVVIFDLAPGMVQDLLPLPGVDIEAHIRSGTRFAEQVRNSWWFAHRKRASRARAVYGDIYNLPPDLGRFDIATFSSILLHLSNPFAALREAARVADKAIVITDIIPAVVYGGADMGLLEFNPGREPENLVNWWLISPGAAVKMLNMLGFAHVEVTCHEVAFRRGHDPAQAKVRRFMYAAVGQRQAGAIPRLKRTEAEIRVDAELRRIIPAVTYERMIALERELYAMHTSLSWRITRPLRLAGKLFSGAKRRAP